MPENDDDSNSITSLHEHVREKIERARKKLTLGARMRFILLFALFDAMFAMFCLLVLLSLRIQSLEESLEEVRVGAQETAVAAATQVAGVRETVEAEMATKIAPLFKPSLVLPTVSPTCLLYTSPSPRDS